MNHIIYHANCADGFTAYWVTQKALSLRNEQWRGVPGKYGTALDLSQFAEGDRVYLVDFSLKPDITKQLLDQGVFIYWLDHHVSAYKTYLNAGLLSQFTVYQYHVNKSGATVCWDYFQDTFARCGVPRPVLLDYVEDRDLWRFKLNLTKEITQEIFSYKYTLGNWDMLMRATASELLRMGASGAGILRKHQKDIDELLEASSHWMGVDEHLVLACNLPYTMASDAAHQLCEQDYSRPFAVCYQIQKDKVIFSFRSLPEGADVSEIASRFGGGGHKNAAGCAISKDSFLQMNGDLQSRSWNELKLLEDGSHGS